MIKEPPVLGVIGGSGLYNITGLSDTHTYDMDTPFGKPSAPIVTGLFGGKKVAFLARHGLGHSYSPSEVNYRANIYAFKLLGIKRLVSISACGSLREDYAPGHIAFPDQLVDFTRTREPSFFSEGIVVHASTANPFCMNMVEQLYRATSSVTNNTHLGGTLITIEGPRFSTRAESNLFRAWGMSLIGMTASPEAFLAREAEMCYATMSHVTDFDVWHVTEDPVTVEVVVRTLMQNTETAQKALEVFVQNLDEDQPCTCHNTLKDAIITEASRIPPVTRHRLKLFLDKYLP